jgi:hypothetical protein
MMLKSGVFIIPAEHQDDGNAFAENTGWGHMVYSVPLSPTGEEPATHSGCRADLYPAFLAMLDDPPEDALPILAVVHMDISDTLTGFDHWTAVLDGLGLVVVQHNNQQQE